MDKKELEKSLLDIKNNVSDYLIPNHKEIYQEIIEELDGKPKNSK